MRCTVKKTLQIARETSNEVIVQVKANQPTLLQGLEQIVATSTPVAVHKSCDRARNRREDRHVHVYDTTAALKGTKWERLAKRRRTRHGMPDGRAYQSASKNLLRCHCEEIWESTRGLDADRRHEVLIWLA